MSLFENEDSSGTIEIAGRPLTCPVCSSQQFWKKQAQLNTAVASFFNLDWANHSATCMVCNNCSHIIWFYNDL
jgi:predicted nucleic-acid-binding Zn-ribbon protein